MKIALLQLNPTVGDLEGNAALIRDGARTAAAAGCTLAITPELTICGYPPRDLLLARDFIARCRAAVERLAAELRDGPAVLAGFPEANSSGVGRPLYNAAALLHAGRVVRTFRKTLLPTYDVFDEDRYFEPVREPQILELAGRRIGVSICEDVWNDRDFWQRRRYARDPLEDLVAQKIDALVNLSASPFSVGKQQLRERMLAALARKYGLPLLYANQVGGNDDLVFDGRSVALAADGRVIARGRAFSPDHVIVDLDAARGDLSTDMTLAEEEIWNALVLGTRDYIRKCGFREVVLGLSGGVDSALVAALAAAAVGPQNVLAVLMPSPYSSRGSIDDSLALAANLGIRTLTLPIAELMRAYDAALKPAFGDRPPDVTEENIQARIRGNLLMALSNKFGSLLLTTGNKSELAVGYCTLYGDMSGGLAAIGDVPKTMVYRVCRWLNRERELIPAAILTKPPSAELKPNQTDQDTLPPYEVLDPILKLHIEQHQSAEEIAAAGFDLAIAQRVVRMVKNAEFKRQQAAPTLRITDLAFGTGWRMPIARR